MHHACVLGWNRQQDRENTTTKSALTCSASSPTDILDFFLGENGFNGLEAVTNGMSIREPQTRQVVQVE